MSDLVGKVAVVTGAAQGIGKAIAIRLAKDGANVVIADLADSKGETTADEISNQYQKSVFIPTDVSNEEMVHNLMERIIEEFGKIDILINNAAILTPQINFEDTTTEYFDKVVSVNLKGVFLCIRGVFKHMKERKSGRIITISSVGGVRPREGMVPYAASKAGAILATQTAAKELASFGVTANIVAPGTTRTAAVTPELEEVFLKSIPNHRLAEPDEIANAVAFLASDAAQQINGIVLPVDGGRLLS